MARAPRQLKVASFWAKIHPFLWFAMVSVALFAVAMVYRADWMALLPLGDRGWIAIALATAVPLLVGALVRRVAIRQRQRVLRIKVTEDRLTAMAGMPGQAWSVHLSQVVEATIERKSLMLHTPSGPVEVPLPVRSRRTRNALQRFLSVYVTPPAAADATDGSPLPPENEVDLELPEPDAEDPFAGMGEAFDDDADESEDEAPTVRWEPEAPPPPVAAASPDLAPDDLPSPFASVVPVGERVADGVPPRGKAQDAAAPADDAADVPSPFAAAGAAAVAAAGAAAVPSLFSAEAAVAEDEAPPEDAPSDSAVDVPSPFASPEPAADDSVDAADAPSDEAVASDAEETSAAEDTPAAEETSAAEDTPAAEETSAAEDTPAADSSDVPSPFAAVAAEEPPAPEELPPAEDVAEPAPEKPEKPAKPAPRRSKRRRRTKKKEPVAAAPVEETPAPDATPPDEASDSPSEEISGVDFMLP